MRGPADTLLVLQKLREASVRGVAREMGAPKSSVDRWLKILVRQGQATVTVWPSRRRTYAVSMLGGIRIEENPYCPVDLAFIVTTSSVQPIRLQANDGP